MPARPAILRAALMAAALLPISAGAANAQAMRVGDLGLIPSRVTCLETAQTVLDAYIAEFGGLATAGDPGDPQEWAIYGWALRPGSNDVVIACPTVVGHTSAFYTVHASGDAAAENADAVAERLRTLWDEHR